ncbi:MoeA C-terminal domain IV [Penicillium hetheringtonii]|uniref:MoeA C-terminal domain IV n=1 Tax=Penicillium hetheringtonii TaxID=911720 RepID=A0AAD6H1B7_9EURO|nr:MoeA C-terminal domain IV [Penicillium hetheringtonii]
MPADSVTIQQYRTDYAHGDLSSTVGLPQSCRTSSSTILSVDEALRIINDQTPKPVAVETSVTTSVIGSVIAEDVYSAGMVPTCHASAVDGYAITVEERTITKGDLPRISSVNTNASERLGPLRPGSVVRTTISSPHPPNANAVIRIEDAYQVGPEKGLVKNLTDDTILGKDVRAPGSYIAEKSQIFARGDIISSVGGAVSLLAMAGVPTIKVFEKPRVGVLSISDGITEYTRQLSDASRLAVISGLVSCGFEFEDLGVAHSTSHCELEYALRTRTHLILIIKDISTNDQDFKSTIEWTLGGFIHFDQVHMKPSRQTLFATIPVNATENPGLDESYTNTAAKPWAKPQLGLPRVAVVLTHHFPLDPKKTDYHLAIVNGSRSDARLYATSISAKNTGAQDSYATGSVKANALIILRAGRGVGIKGEIVEALLMGPVHGSDVRLIC